MSKARAGLIKGASRRVCDALAAAVALAAVFGSPNVCSETIDSGAAAGTMRLPADANENVEPDFAFDIVPTNEMAATKGAAGTSSLRLLLPRNPPLVALPLEGVKSSVKPLADATYPHFSIVAEGANIAAALHLNATVEMPGGGRVVIDLAQRVQQ